MFKPRPAPDKGFAILRLQPDPAAAAALARLVEAYAGLSAWLDATIPADHSADRVALHRAYYERARQRAGLPAQLTTLALHDWAARRRGQVAPGVPLDDKLYAVKGLSTATISTLDGRIALPFAVAGYGDRWPGGAPARLTVDGDRWELRVESDRESIRLAKEEKVMATETTLTRIGRLIAGMTHAAIGAAENANPRAVLEQALREIDAAADEVRGEMGKAMAERTRLDLRRKELARELADLEEKARLAVRKGRDDLAEAGIGRQIDIEAQTGVLDRLLADAQDRIDQFEQTLNAVRASRREAEARLADMARTSGEGAADPGAGAGETRVGRALDKVERAQSVIGRMSGVPADTGGTDHKAIDELNDLARRDAVAARLARLKGGAS